MKNDSNEKVKENQVIDENSPVKLKFDVDKVNKYVKEQILNKLNEKNFFRIQDKDLSLGGAG